MLPKITEPYQPALTLDRRNTNRRLISIGVEAAHETGMTPVVLLDLSRTGMRIQSFADFEVGKRLDVAIPEAGTVSATITWKITSDTENKYGAKFQKPITDGSVSAALLNAPPTLPFIGNKNVMPGIHEEKLSRLARLGLLVGLATASWMLIGGAAYAIAQSIR